MNKQLKELLAKRIDLLMKEGEIAKKRREVEKKIVEYHVYGDEFFYQKVFNNFYFYPCQKKYYLCNEFFGQRLLKFYE